MATCRMTPGKFKGVSKMQSQMASELGRTLQTVGDKLMQDVRINLSGRVLHARSGKLRANVEQKINQERDNVTLKIGTDLSVVPYARIHELGGWTGQGHRTKIPKRPYLRRALVENKDFIRRSLDTFTARLTRLH